MRSGSPAVFRIELDPALAPLGFNVVDRVPLTAHTGNGKIFLPLGKQESDYEQRRN